jgi:superfamily II DNA or RNA helicase
MPLRPQQQKLHIIKHNPLLKNLFLFWSPGGGKSLAPPILSDLLTENKKQIWVVPRNSLKQQGESDYQNDYFYTNKTCRIANNSGDPFRGCDSCVTTYQAIAANPEKWRKICTDYDVMLILDEFHHLSGHGDWIKIIKEMESLSFLSVFMTGTISRGDDTKIPFVPYKNDKIDFSNTDSRKWIIYTREQAIKDRSILTYDTFLIDGSGQFIDKNGVTRNFHTFGDSGDNLRAAFKTEYAYTLIDIAFSHWNKYRVNNKWSKNLIVAPNIETAKEYLEYIKSKYKNIRSEIATSEDSTECKNNIELFKNENKYYSSIDCLVTVGVAYEGLSVVQCSHMIIMTLIRSEPWLDQCTARCVRNYPGKDNGFVFAPKDMRMIKALKNISSGAIKDATGEAPEPPKPKDENSDNDSTGYNNGIEALSSKAHITEEFPDFQPPPVKQETQSEIEKRLRTEINHVINTVVGATGNGNKHIKSRVFWLKVKLLVNKGRDEKGKLIRKKVEEMSVKELQKVAEFCKNNY